MRSEADRLSEALDPRLMGPRLAAALGGAPTCHVLDAKYEPGVRATILYGLASRLVRGDLLGPCLEDRTDACGGHVIAPGLLVREFPDDPDLPALPRVTDPVHLGRALAPLRDASAARAAVRCRIQLLRYRPGKRATVLAQMAPSLPAVVAKAYHAPDKAVAVATEASALSSLVARGETLRLAPLVGTVAEWGVVVQEAVVGTGLDVFLASRGATDPRAVEGVRLAARALAEWHELPAVTSRRRSEAAELQRFETRAAGAASLDPAFAAAALRLAGRLLERHAELPSARPGLVHGDCKPSQFLLGDAHVHLLDLDHCGVSDQATDVGTFLASLRQLAVRRDLARGARGERAELESLGRLFLRTYLTTRGGDLADVAGRVPWQQAVALERKALRAFARAPHSTLAPALLKEADRCLDAA